MTTKKKNTKNILPFKFNLEQLFSLDKRTEYSPEHLFLAYFGDLPSAYSFQRFNREKIMNWVKANYSKEIVKTIKHEIFYTRGKVNDDGIIFVLSSQLILRMEGILTSIYYSETSEEAAQKLVKEILPLEWKEEEIISANLFLYDNVD